MKVNEQTKSPTDPISVKREPKNLDHVRQEKHEKLINRKWFDIDRDLYKDLVKHFGPPSTKLVKVLPDGSVDVYATLRNNGAYEVLSYIEQRMQLGEQNK